MEPLSIFLVRFALFPRPRESGSNWSCAVFSRQPCQQSIFGWNVYVAKYRLRYLSFLMYFCFCVRGNFGSVLLSLLFGGRILSFGANDPSLMKTLECFVWVRVLNVVFINDLRVPQSRPYMSDPVEILFRLWREALSQSFVFLRVSMSSRGCCKADYWSFFIIPGVGWWSQLWSSLFLCDLRTN